MQSTILISAVAAVSAKLPHLIFVLIDDMGHNDFYSSSDLASAWPNVAKLAEEQCIKVDNYYTQPICTPTRGAFMTGRMPIRLGLQHNVIDGFQDYGLPLDEMTLAQKLKAEGYRTVGVGKWHLGVFKNASLPTSRGFDHFYGFMNGLEDHWTHAVGAHNDPTVPTFLDLRDDNVIDRTKNGSFGQVVFAEKAVQRIHEHRIHFPGKPLFLYYPMQTLHEPLEAPDVYRESAACNSIINSDRKTFCGMARAADDAIGNVTAALDAAFPGEDVVIILSGDNGGQPAMAGNQCPTANDPMCLRGLKGTVFEGGIRNNALLCSKTLIPSHRYGATHSKGLVHVMDWHATLRDLAGAQDQAMKPTDGVSIWDAIVNDTASPRTEFLVNIDPCSGHGACNGASAAFRLNGCVGNNCGDWKIIYGQQGPMAGWFALPTTLEHEGNYGAIPGPSGSVIFDDASAAQNSTYLFNISADPGEHMDLSNKYPEVVEALEAKIQQHWAQSLPPCNIPGGSCSFADDNGRAACEAANAWVPWVAEDETPSSVQQLVV